MGDTTDDQQPTGIESGAAGAPEGAVGAEPTADEIKELYDATGVKAPVPTGKPKGRPKTSDGGDKKASKDEDAGGESGKGRRADDGKDKSKSASDSDSDGSDGNDADSKGSKNGSKDGKNGQKDSKVSDDSDKDAEGVSKTKSSDNGEAAKSGKDDADKGADDAGGGAEAGAAKSGDSKGDGEDEDSGSEGSEDEKGKRPGKSNPEVEKRFQKLTSEVKERDTVIADLQKKLLEKDQLVEKTKTAQEDPEYKIEDFKMVRDNATGEIKELSDEQAELAWRRWKDGWDERSSRREAETNRKNTEAANEAEMTAQLLQKSVTAYDTLAALMDEYPELVSTSGKFDEDFAADAMPIIEEAIQYLPGTEPGNKEDKLPVIVGLKVDPKKILAALRSIGNKKRNLPLNGVNDNVESRSNVNVPHSRSSDPTVNAANDLYKELGINKRI